MELRKKIRDILGDQAALFDHQCRTIAVGSLASSMTVVDDMLAQSNRTARVLGVLTRMMSPGQLANTGYLSILPVDQGIEHPSGARFAPDPRTPDENAVRLAIEGGCSAVASTGGGRGTIACRYAHKIPFIVKINHNELISYPKAFDQTLLGDIGAAIQADISKWKLVEPNAAFSDPVLKGFGKTHKKVYFELTTDNPVDLARYQVANCDATAVVADRLTSAATAISSAPGPAAAVSIRPHVDIGIMTIRDDEFRAVLRALPAKAGVFKGTHREYTLRHAELANGERYMVAVLRQVEQGNGEAQDAARDLIDDLAPKLVLVVGIAGGIPSDDVRLGDVIVSTQIHDFTVGAKKTGEETTYAATGWPIDKTLAAAVANLAGREDELGDWTAGLPEPPAVTWTQKGQLYGPSEWQRKLRSQLERHHGRHSTPRAPMYVAGPIASSDRLVKDPELLFPWIATARNLLAVEMESGGVFRAARERCLMLAIRGISDIVGLKRVDAWAKFACASAAAFTCAFLRTRPVPVGSPLVVREPSAVLSESSIATEPIEFAERQRHIRLLGPEDVLRWVEVCGNLGTGQGTVMPDAEESRRSVTTRSGSPLTMRLFYRDSVRDLDNEIYVLRDGPQRVKRLWCNFRSRVFILLYQRFMEIDVHDERNCIRFPGGRIGFSVEKDEESLFGDYSVYDTEVEIELSPPSYELITGAVAVLGKPKEYAACSVIPSGVDINTIFRHSGQKGIDILGFEPRTSLRVKLPVGKGEASVKVASGKTEITIISEEMIDIDEFDPALVIRWLNGENVVLEVSSVPEREREGSSPG